MKQNNFTIKRKLFEILEDDYRCFGFSHEKGKHPKPCVKKSITISHLIKGLSDSQYKDYQNTIPMCLDCHMVYERLPDTNNDGFFKLKKGVSMTRSEYLETAYEAYQYTSDANTRIAHLIERAIHRINYLLNGEKEVRIYGN